MKAVPARRIAGVVVGPAQGGRSLLAVPRAQGARNIGAALREAGGSAPLLLATCGSLHSRTCGERMRLLRHNTASLRVHSKEDSAKSGSRCPSSCSSAQVWLPALASLVVRAR